MSGHSFSHRIQFSDDGGLVFATLSSVDPSLRVDRIRQLIYGGIIFESQIRGGGAPIVQSSIPTAPVQQTVVAKPEKSESQPKEVALATPAIDDVMSAFGISS